MSIRDWRRRRKVSKRSEGLNLAFVGEEWELSESELSELDDSVSDADEEVGEVKLRRSV